MSFRITKEGLRWYSLYKKNQTVFDSLNKERASILRRLIYMADTENDLSNYLSKTKGEEEIDTALRLKDLLSLGYVTTAESPALDKVLKFGKDAELRLLSEPNDEKRMATLDTLEWMRIDILSRLFDNDEIKFLE